MESTERTTQSSRHKGFSAYVRSLLSGMRRPDRFIDAWTSSREYCERLLEVYREMEEYREVQPAELAEWTSDRSFRLTVDGLQAVPRLQAAVADYTSYTPSKWLLEKELARRSAPQEQSEAFLLEEELKARRQSPDANYWRTFTPGAKTWDGTGDVYDAADDANLKGLAFSGGGVRSATFCLGVLQAFASAVVLSRFDYLSSISGGGYIHQWFASWIYNQKSTPKLERVQDLLRPLPEPQSPARQPAQIQWLRRYASYLTPQRGVFSLDTWTMICIWFRNTFLNQIVLFGVLVSCVLAIRGVLLPFVYGLQHNNRKTSMLVIACMALIAAYQFLACFFLADALNSQKASAQPGAPAPGALRNGQVAARIVAPGFLMSCAVAMQALLHASTHSWHTFVTVWAVSLFCMLIALVAGGMRPVDTGSWEVKKARVALMACVTAAIFAAGAGWCAHRLASPAHQGDKHSVLYGAARHAASHIDGWLATAPPFLKLHQEVSAGPGYTSALDVQLSVPRGQTPPLVQPEALFALFAPLTFLFLQFLAVRLQLGVLGSAWAECRREWMARFGAWNGIVGVVWILLGSITWLGPVVCYWFSRTSTWHRISSVAAVAIVHAVTLYAGGSGKADGKPKPGTLLGYSTIDLLGMVGAPLCIFSILIVVAGAVDSVCGALHSPYHLLKMLLFAAVTVLVFLFFGWRVDVNEFSMHGFYRNRLARCYLGATNMMRTPDPFTGFDEHTEARSRTGIPISELLPIRFGGKEDGYDGPFPIFGSTLNLTFGEDLAWQERKGASFAFTPLYSGYHVGWTGETRSHKQDTTFNGFVPTASFAYRGGTPLATAAAISGAALSPNQGVNSQPALAFLMTLFNVRLGWWIANPRKPKVWPSTNNSPTPWFGLRYLLGELFGMADDTSKYVCLSDGGQFENMGLYELVRRRCRFIVICDAEADSDYTFEGIGRAISKCRTDFGAEIDLDLLPLRPDPWNGGYSDAHFVEGTITYPAPPRALSSDPGRTYTGRIFYLKSSITGNEPGDILHHRLEHPAFPNDTTINQWFTESQFESYRRLGQLIGSEAVKAF